MNYIKSFFHQSSYYFVGNILIVFAGFISFPIWTRFFSRTEYGILSILSITISFLVTFSKFGLQHAALRFYADFKEKKRDLDIACYYTTMLLGSFLFAGFIALVILLITKIIFSNFINKTILQFLPLIVVIALMMSVKDVLTTIVRAEQRAKFWNIIQVVTRYGRLFLAIFIVFVFMGNLYGLFLGWAISIGSILIILIIQIVYQKKIDIKKFSLPLLKESIKYGFPLIWFELSNIILSQGDRYLIQYYMGSESVGIYSAGYNLTDMVRSSISMPFQLAIVPIFLSIWNKNGEEKTKHFLTRTLNYYFMIGIPIIFGMSWFGKEIITLLASSKFQESHIIIPYIIFPLIIYGAYTIYGAGLYIHKKTSILMYFTFLSGLVNILLNLFLIPYHGILGAAYATSISYLILISLIAKSSYKYLKIKIQITPLLRYSLLSTIIMFFISRYSTDDVDQILIKFFIGLFSYLTGILILDANIRKKVFLLIGIR